MLTIHGTMQTGVFATGDSTERRCMTVLEKAIGGIRFGRSWGQEGIMNLPKFPSLSSLGRYRLFYLSVALPVSHVYFACIRHRSNVLRRFPIKAALTHH